MSKEQLIDFIEKVANDPKYKDEAEWLLLLDRKSVGSITDRMEWEVLDALHYIIRGCEDNCSVWRQDAIEIIKIVQRYTED